MRIGKDAFELYYAQPFVKIFYFFIKTMYEIYLKDSKYNQNNMNKGRV